VILKFESNFEIPDGIVIFEIVTSSKLILSANGTVWNKMSGISYGINLKYALLYY